MKKLLSLILCITLFAGFEIRASATTAEPASLGVWWWSISSILQDDADEKIEFCKNQGVTEIYLSANNISASADVSSARNYKNVGNFIAKCNAKGIKVSYLCGDVSYMRSESKLNSIFENYNSYQNQADTNEKFYGIHFDVEPHTDPEYKNGTSDDKAGVIQLYATGFLERLVEYRENGFTDEIELDIPVWFDKYNVTFLGNENVPLLSAIAQSCTSMVLMDYRTKAASAWSSAANELVAAQTYGCKIVFGFCLNDSGEGPDVDFSSLGLSAYNEFYNAFCEDYMTPAWEQGTYTVKHGCAVHHMKTWYEMFIDVQTEPSTEPTSEPLTEPVTEPAADPTTEPHSTPATEPAVTACECMCHSQNGFMQFIWKIITFFNKLFGVTSKRICACGTYHW